jgi:glyoxylase-like metal-dependent hydrolase (beta-lactamase superfamily II)
MLTLESSADVTRLRFTGWRSRSSGYEVSAYLVRGTLVDTGCACLGAALEQWLAVTPLAGAIVTHYHEDHAGNVERVASRGVPLWLAEPTRRNLAAPGPVRLYRRFTWGAPPPLRTPVRPYLPDDLEVIPTPGHSEDHHVVFDPATGTLFGGDLYLGVKVRVAHPGEDPRRHVASLRQVLARSPARLFDAHRGLVPDPTRALVAKIAWMEDTVGAIDRLVARGWGDRAIQREVLGPEELLGYLSGGEYSRLNLVRAVRRSGGA